eukprot:UN23476
MIRSKGGIQTEKPLVSNILDSGQNDNHAKTQKIPAVEKKMVAEVPQAVEVNGGNINNLDPGHFRYFGDFQCPVRKPHYQHLVDKAFSRYAKITGEYKREIERKFDKNIHKFQIKDGELLWSTQENNVDEHTFYPTVCMMAKALRINTHIKDSQLYISFASSKSQDLPVFNAGADRSENNADGILVPDFTYQSAYHVYGYKNYKKLYDKVMKKGIEDWGEPGSEK